MKLIDTILTASSLTANLSQEATNGGSILGTLDAPYLPLFLTNNPLPRSLPWAYATVNQTNPYEEVPNTGVIRQYHFTLERGWLAPDGVLKYGIFINGQFPGPMIEANWGDTVQVTVDNNIDDPEEGTAIHWHGLLQKDTPWFDGVPSVSQCPIAPNSSFTYSFKADSYGSSWYHAHYSAQYADGAFGPMVIHGPTHVEYDIDVGPVMLTDHFHTDYFSIVELIMGNNKPPNSDNNLINGKMSYDCSLATGYDCTPNAGVSKFKFQSGKKHRLRLMNAGAEGIQKFSIDNHTITVIANDFVPVTPYQVDVVTLGVGQRTDIIVEGTGSPADAVWMRSDVSEFCSLANQSHALAAIYYEDADTSSTPQSIATPWNDTYCGNDPLEITEPFFEYGPPETPEITQHIDISFGPNATNHTVWKMNNVSFRANLDHPILLLTKLGNTTYPDDPEWNVYNFQGNTSVRLIISTAFPVAHPMHLHGHNFWVVAQGRGEWDGTVTRPSNPQRRDTQLLQGGIPALNGTINTPAIRSYIVLDFLADNPGVWPLHCHIAWHVSGGLYVNIMERPDLVTADLQVPSIMAQTCRDWADYSGHDVVDQIDSGL